MQGLVGQSEQALLQSVQTRTQAELESAREKYKKAHEDGDTDGMVAAQEQLARVQADRAYLDNYFNVYVKNSSNYIEHKSSLELFEVLLEKFHKKLNKK